MGLRNLQENLENPFSTFRHLTSFFSFQNLEKDRNQLNHENEKFRDQNAKLKEEMTTLITSFHSLKDSHQMLQVSFNELKHIGVKTFRWLGDIKGQ